MRARAQTSDSAAELVRRIREFFALDNRRAG